MRCSFPAVILKENNRYTVRFPDFGIVGEGYADLETTEEFAADMLAEILHDKIIKKGTIPSPSDIDSIEIAEDEYKLLISTDIDEYQKRLSHRPKFAGVLSTVERADDAGAHPTINRVGAINNKVAAFEESAYKSVIITGFVILVVVMGIFMTMRQNVRSREEAEFKKQQEAETHIQLTEEYKLMIEDAVNKIEAERYGEAINLLKPYVDVYDYEDDEDRWIEYSKSKYYEYRDKDNSIATPDLIDLYAYAAVKKGMKEGMSLERQYFYISNCNLSENYSFYEDFATVKKSISEAYIEASKAPTYDSSSKEGVDREEEVEVSDNVNESVDDKDIPKVEWNGFTFERPISYNEMLVIFEDYYMEYMKLTPIDMYSTDEEVDAAIEEEMELAESIADKYNLTVDDFTDLFFVIDTVDQNRIKLKVGYFD